MTVYSVWKVERPMLAYVSSWDLIRKKKFNEHQIIQQDYCSSQRCQAVTP